MLYTDNEIIIAEPFNIQVIAAAATVAFSSPTPTPFNIAWVANVPVIDEQNA